MTQIAADRPVDRPADAAFPTLDARALAALAVAGAFATLAFDLFGQTLSPLLRDVVPTLGAKLAPTPLANAVIAKLTGLQGVGKLGLGHGVHVLTGVLAYPLAWALIARPLARRVAPWLPEMAAAALYGVALWVFALYGMAHLIAGNPPFLGFTGITWVALYGHVLYALVAAAIWRRLT